jgi:hypothetical protein
VYNSMYSSLLEPTDAMEVCENSKEKNSAIINAFAQAISALCFELKNSKLSIRERRILNSTISDILKKIGDLHPSGASIAAYNKFQKISIAGDIRNLTWQQQPKYDPGRRIFHREHMIPISSLRQKCIEGPEVETVLQIIQKEIKIVWILKTEDSELSKNGHRHKRPDPEGAYKTARIKIMKPENNWGI